MTPAQQNGTYPKWLDLTTDREQARLDRVQAGSHIIPAPLWVILFVTAILVIAFTFLFADPPEGVVAAGDDRGDDRRDARRRACSSSASSTTRTRRASAA